MNTIFHTPSVFRRYGPDQNGKTVFECPECHKVIKISPTRAYKIWVCTGFNVTTSRG